MSMPTIESLKPGARTTCEPSGASVGSRDDGMTISIIGVSDGLLNIFASKKASSSNCMFSQLINFSNVILGVQLLRMQSLSIKAPFLSKTPFDLKP
ncbi:hypothetical protein BpHYR1_003193 [Brachionus plicatilis]|uniref:Uncharacterized protein n=1 Tax=Brachionus plicatilis TaxID=10195 RepID=A0A3M7QZX1_BRAPC|nr:hypothetical protein BpHYR1_003193 [Brachionus plicatilis]